MNKPKAILFVIDNFTIGGTVTTIAAYAQIANKNNFKSIVLGQADNLNNPQDYFPHSACIILPKYKQLRFINKLTAVFLFLKSIRSIYKTYKITHIHFSSVWSTIYCLLYPKVWHTKRIFTVHNFYALEVQSQKTVISLFTKFKLLILLHIQGVCLLFSHNTTTFSAYAESLIRKYYPYLKNRPITIIPGLITDMNSVDKRKPYKKPRIYQLLTIARAEPRKGIRLLLEAIKILTKTNKKIRLKLVSPVSYYEWSGVLNLYEQLNLENAVHLLHAANESQKNWLFKTSHLAIMPSTDLETFGIFTIECLARGIPVIGYDNGATREILRNVDHRLICHETTAQALAQKIIWFANLSEKEVQKLSEKSAMTVKKLFALEKYRAAIKNSIINYR